MKKRANQFINFVLIVYITLFLVSCTTQTSMQKEFLFNSNETELLTPIHLAMPSNFIIKDKLIDPTRGLQFRAYGPVEEGFQVNLWITVERGKIDRPLEEYANKSLEITKDSSSGGDETVYNRFPVNIDNTTGYHMNLIMKDNEGTYRLSHTFYEKGGYIVFITFSYPYDRFEYYDSVLINQVYKYIAIPSKFIKMPEGIFVSYGPAGTIYWPENIENFKKYEPWCSDCMRFMPENLTLQRPFYFTISLNPDQYEERLCNGTLFTRDLSKEELAERHFSVGVMRDCTNWLYLNYTPVVVRVNRENQNLEIIDSFSYINQSLLNVSSLKFGKYCVCAKEKINISDMG